MRDEKYYKRLSVLSRFAFRSVLIVAFIVMAGLTFMQIYDQVDQYHTLPIWKRVFFVVVFSILAVLYKVPPLLNDLKKIDLGDRPAVGAVPKEPPYAKQLEHARKEGYIDQDNRLLRPRSDFVRFCIDYIYFYPYGRAEWKVLDNVLKDTEGNPISSEKLAQTFQDIKTREGI